MNAEELLLLIRSARALLDLGLTQARLAEQEGRLTEAQKAAILAAAQTTDQQVDDVVAAARLRLTDSEGP